MTQRINIGQDLESRYLDGQRSTFQQQPSFVFRSAPARMYLIPHLMIFQMKSNLVVLFKVIFLEVVQGQDS